LHDDKGPDRIPLAADGDEVLRTGEEFERVGGEGLVVVERLGRGGAEEIQLADAIVVEEPVGVGDDQQGGGGG